jgi:hypothetical protein
VSRRSQSRRRRTYGRRQHEVRERRPDVPPGNGWLGDSDTQFDADWPTGDSVDDRAGYGEAFGSYGR